MDADPCPICAGHRSEGPLVAPVVWRDDLVWVEHVVDRAMPVPLGHLVVETARHTAYVDSLRDDEAAALGVARRRAAVALRAELDVEAVHAYLSNRSFEHVHGVVRAPGPALPRRLRSPISCRRRRPCDGGCGGRRR